MYLFVYEVSLRDRSYNRLRHRAFHGEAVPGDEKLNAKIPQLFVMNQKTDEVIHDKKRRYLFNRHQNMNRYRLVVEIRDCFFAVQIMNVFSISVACYCTDAS